MSNIGSRTFNLIADKYLTLANEEYLRQLSIGSNWSKLRLGAMLALTAPEATYDWQVRADLSTWSALLTSGAAVVGLAAGERQRYRGVALAFLQEIARALPPAPLGYGALVAAGPARALG